MLHASAFIYGDSATTCRLKTCLAHFHISNSPPRTVGNEDAANTHTQRRFIIVIRRDGLSSDLRQHPLDKSRLRPFKNRYGATLSDGEVVVKRQGGWNKQKRHDTIRYDPGMFCISHRDLNHRIISSRTGSLVAPHRCQFYSPTNPPSTSRHPLSLC